MGHVYLLKQKEKACLVDTGHQGDEKQILKMLAVNGVKDKNLKFIFITHAHYDHAGSAAALQQATGAPLIVHQKEASYLQQGFRPLPKGTAPLFKFMIEIGKRMGNTFAAFPAVNPDITFGDKMDLSSAFGMEGMLMHTPGHTAGSSVLFSGGNVFAGDTVFNIWGGRVYPIFADDEKRLRESWKKLLAMNIKTFYPTHGKRFSMDVFKRKAAEKGVYPFDDEIDKSG